jgi:hypothetical protein
MRAARAAPACIRLAANPKHDAAYPALTALVRRRAMPAFADSPTNEQVAEVVNYVRSHFDNRRRRNHTERGGGCGLRCRQRANRQRRCSRRLITPCVGRWRRQLLHHRGEPR